jgi:hypothetical protein
VPGGGISLNGQRWVLELHEFRVQTSETMTAVAATRLMLNRIAPT